jgi:phosphoglycerate-specific signal transduction histidine kinase
MMRKLDSVVKPSTESLRERKQNLVEEIRRRRQKISEIENCDQNLLKALKEEAKDLA